MITVKCRAENENNLPPKEFYKLFIEECMKEGTIIQRVLSPERGIATVIREEK